MQIGRFVWRAKSSYAKRCIALAFLVWLVLVAVAWWNPSFGLKYGHWTNRELALLIGMLMLVVAAQVVHLCDCRSGGYGLKHVYETDNRGSHRQDELSYVPSTMTAESIRAAMIAALLIAFLTERDKYLPPSVEPPIFLRGLVIRQVLAEPGALFFCLVVGALAASIVFTLVTLLCYEYICRYEWTGEIAWAKDDLRRKAFDLGTAGFYCLMWALAIAPALLDYRLGFMSMLFVFCVLWYYYFFPVPTSQSLQARSVGAL